MKNQSRSLKLFALALLALGFAAVKDLSDASAHEGHKKGHAPATAKTLRNPVEHNTANIENGKALYETNCASCHGADGKGEQYNRKAKIKVPDLKSHYVMKLAECEIFYVITNGIKTSGMPAYKLKASDRERWQLALYVRHLSMDEAEHAPLFANIGLPFTGKPSAGQKFFRAETGDKTASSRGPAGKTPGAGR